MPKSSVFSNPSYRANLPKTTFPMTQEIDFSSVAGTLTPIFCDFLAPGEKISGHAEMFTRTAELQTAAFAKIDEYIEYFFVPAMKLNQIFGEWFFDIDDRPTTLRPSQLPERANVLPNITYSRLKAYMNSVKNSQLGSVTTYELSRSESLVRLLQHYRYDVYAFFDSTGQVTEAQESNIWNIPLVPFQVYQAVYYDYYRDSLWQNNDVEAYNTDDWLTSLTADNISDSRLGKIFQLHQRRQNADYYSGSHPSPLQNQTGMLNINGVRENALLQVNQWLQESGVGYQFVSKDGSNTAVKVSTPIPTTGIHDSDLSLSGDGSVIGSIPESVYKMTRAMPPDENWVNGQNQNLLTSPGNVDRQDRLLLAGSENQLVKVQFRGSNGPFDVLSTDGSIPGLSVQGFQNALGSLKSSISSVGIRTMFALEKLAQITGRAGKHYDDQVFAHYGVKISPAYSNECQMIGQQHSTIEIGEIVSPTTVPDGSVAGEIVGKGYGNMTGDKVVDFVAPCHGYFLAVYSAVPRRVYTPCGNPREYSDLYRFDFVQPELMNLGQQPLFWTEFDLRRSISTYPIAAWNWRYMEKKCRVGLAIGALSRFDRDDQSENGILSDWTIQYPVLNEVAHSTTSLAWQDFLVLPSAFNSIMLVQYDRSQQFLGQDAQGKGKNNKVARLFDSDPLFHRLTMKLYKSSYMSTFGEPRID